MPKEVKITEVLDQVESKIKELGGDKPCYITDGNVDGLTNILSDESIESLVRSDASITVREKAFNDSVKKFKKLGLDVNVEFELNGNKPSDLLKDIQTRITFLNNKSVIDELKVKRDELKELVTKEEKRAKVIKDLKGLL